MIGKLFLEQAIVIGLITVAGLIIGRLIHGKASDNDVVCEYEEEDL